MNYYEAAKDENGMYSFSAECDLRWHSLNRESQEKLIKLFNLSKDSSTDIDHMKEYLGLTQWSVDNDLDVSIIPVDKINFLENKYNTSQQRSSCEI